MFRKVSFEQPSSLSEILKPNFQETSNVWPISACLWVMCHTPLTKTKANGLFPLFLSVFEHTITYTHTHSLTLSALCPTHPSTHSHAHETPISLVKCVAKVGSSAEQQMSSGRSMEVKNGEKKKIFKNLLLCRSSEDLMTFKDRLHRHRQTSTSPIFFSSKEIFHLFSSRWRKKNQNKNKVRDPIL